MKKFASALSSIITLLGGIILFAILLVPVLGFTTYQTIETYAFDATVTDKAVVDERHQPRCYILFFVDGDEAGEVWVTSADYARHSIGDLIRVEVEVRENIFGKIEENYEFGVDRWPHSCYNDNVERDKSPRQEREETTMKNTENKVTMTNDQFKFLLNHLYELAKDRGLTDEEILHELADKMEEMVAQGYRVEG